MRSLHLLGLALLAAILCATPAAFATDINQKLDAIVLDDINFKDTPLLEALLLLNNNIRLRVPKGQGVSVILMLTDDARDHAPITLKMTQPTLRATVEAFAANANLLVKVEPYAVVLLSKDLSTDR